MSSRLAHAGPLQRLRAVTPTAGSLLAAAMFLGLTGCDRAENQRAQGDVADAAHQAGAAVDRAAGDTQNSLGSLAGDAKPAADRVVRDAKHGVNTLAVAAGKATQKAGAALEDAGERAQGHDKRPARGD